MLNYMFKILFSILLLCMFVCNTNAQDARQGYNYVDENGEKQYLHLTPSDKETEELIKKYRVRTITTMLGTFVKADEKVAMKDHVRPIVTGNVIYIRKGFTEISDEQFTALIQTNLKKFDNFPNMDMSPRMMKMVLNKELFLFPEMKDKEIVPNGHLKIHNVLLEYWSKCPDKVRE